MIRKHVTSTNISSVGYVDDILEVEFNNGSVYRYFGVPERHYTQMANFAHPGTYFARNVKNAYRYVRVK